MNIDDIITGMNSTVEMVQLQAVQACRKMLSREKNPPIDEMINKGVVPLCIQFLNKKYRSVLLLYIYLLH